MTSTETVKVELDLPAHVHKAVAAVCERFNYDLNKLFVESITGDLEASATCWNFGDYMDNEENEDFAREIEQILGEKA